jgi:hypothetical protein
MISAPRFGLEYSYEVGHLIPFSLRGGNCFWQPENSYQPTYPQDQSQGIVSSLTVKVSLGSWRDASEAP